MPLLDVSDVLSDPMFAEEDPILVTRTARTVGGDGFVSEAAPVTFTIEGVVTQGSGSQLVRSADGSMVLSTITIHTTTALTASSPGVDADVVTWQGRAYTVTNVADWSTYGGGMYSVVATMIPPAGG